MSEDLIPPLRWWPKVPLERIKEVIKQARSRGVTVHQIAKELGHSEMTIHKRMREFSDKYRGRFTSEWVPAPKDHYCIQQSLYKWVFETKR